jgi:hypothetical protein
MSSSLAGAGGLSTVDPGKVETDEDLLAPLRKANIMDDETVHYNALEDTRCPILNGEVAYDGVNGKADLQRFIFNQTHTAMNLQAPSPDKAGFRICKTFPTFDQLADKGVVPPVEEVMKSDEKRVEAMRKDPAAQYAHKLHTQEEKLNVFQWYTWMPYLLGTEVRPQDYATKKIQRIFRKHQVASVAEFEEHNREVENYKANVQVGFEAERAKDLERLIVKKKASPAGGIDVDAEGVEVAPTKLTVTDPKTGMELTRTNRAEELEEMTQEELAKLRAAEAPEASGGAEETKSEAEVDTAGGVMPSLAGITFPDEETTVDYINGLPKTFHDDDKNIAIVSIIEDITDDEDKEHVLVVYGFVKHESEIEAALARVRHYVRLFRVEPVPMHQWVAPHELLNRSDVRRVGATRTQRMINVALEKGKEMDRKEQEATRAQAIKNARFRLGEEREGTRLLEATHGTLTTDQKAEMDDAMKDFLATMG